jgi:hypothetical protein
MLIYPIAPNPSETPVIEHRNHPFSSSVIVATVAPLTINVPAVPATFASITTNNVALKHAIVDIGEWDMDSNEFKFVDIVTPLSVSVAFLYPKIRSISVSIFKDSGVESTVYTSDLRTSGNFYFNVSDGANSGVLTLQRSASGGFDNSSYNATSYNRGKILITYEV